ncbi:hypothetical protein N9V91_05850, partial [Acidimicrobiaceae bacterium]|nr:hypothetical protein [Acidimicrobiaceae bacterium]
NAAPLLGADQTLVDVNPEPPVLRKIASATSPDPARALAGIRVVDFGWRRLVPDYSPASEPKSSGWSPRKDPTRCAARSVPTVFQTQTWAGCSMW